MLLWYENSDCKTLETAVVHQNLYETAPLTAVILFETEQPETVTVTVHGKEESGDITYTTNRETHHEVQIFGLYAGYANRVTLETESGNMRDFIIRTERLPDVLTHVEKTAGEEKALGNRLYYLCDKWRTVFDCNGDIRWYMWNLSTAFSGIDEVDPQTHSFWFSTEGSSSSMATIYCMSFTGRVRGKFFILGKSAHHDAALLPDGRLLYFSKWREKSAELSILDPTDGSVTLYCELQDLLFDPEIGSLEYETREHPWDITHPNAVEYIPENNSLLLSFRNQHVIACMDFDTKELKWVLTPSYTVNGEGKAEAIQEKLTEYLILPEEGDTEFEWFYSQHSPKVVSCDSASDLYEIVVFDNGTDRFLAADAENPDRNQGKYSRLVRYRIDAAKKTVSQIYEYGQDRPEYYSDQCGSVQYLEEEERYVGNFPGVEKNDQPLSIVTESDARGSEIAEFYITNTTDGTYRVSSLDLDAYAETENRISAPLVYTEHYDLLDKGWKECNYEPSGGSETYNLERIEITENGFTIRGSIRTEEEDSASYRFRLLATDQNGKQYEMALICYRDKYFFMPGISMDTLPPGVYRFGIYAEANKVILGYKDLDYKYTTETDREEIPAKDEILVLAESEASSCWKVELVEHQITGHLETVVPVTQYDGSIDEVSYSNDAPEGKKYVLLKLKVSKDGKGTGDFSWENVCLRDAEGNVYHRINDSFLSDHEYERMAGTDIKFGSKTGWICFEIPEAAGTEKMEFVY